MNVFGVVRFRPGRFWPLPAFLACLMMLPVGGPVGQQTALAVMSEQENCPAVYLTFDDGPSGNTMALLEVLEEYGIRATFFVTGQYEGNTADLLRCIADRGHSIGLHSYDHRYDEIYSYSEAFFADLQRVDELVQQATGQRAVLYRFPGGSMNSHCPQWLREELRRLLEERGYIYHDWNVVSGDQGSRVLAAEELLGNVKADAAQVQEGPLVILFHDTNHCATTPEGVKMVIEHFLEEGYCFLPLTPQTPPVRF